MCSSSPLTVLPSFHTACFTDTNYCIFYKSIFSLNINTRYVDISDSMEACIITSDHTQIKYFFISCMYGLPVRCDFQEARRVTVCSCSNVDRWETDHQQITW